MTQEALTAAPNNLQPLAAVQRGSRALWRQRAWIAAPAVLATILGLTYALVKPVVWRATQAILVREEGGGMLQRSGRFESIDQMKAFQETVLEIARRPQVVAQALAVVGPEDGPRGDEPWPSAEQIAALQAAISVTAPQGAEFGRTEVIYLSVTAPTRERAIALTAALGDQLDAHLQHVRALRAQSLVQELQRTCELARADLNASTERLQAMESQVGPDLGELRSLSTNASGESNLRLTLNQIKDELRQADTQLLAVQQMLTLLQEAQADPSKFLALPNEVLLAQPALQKLRDGLVAAQLRTAELLGAMQPAHPSVQAAIRSEQEVQADLRLELGSAIAGLQGDLRIGAQRAQLLQSQLEDVTTRLDRLANLRAGYENLVAEVQARHTTLSAKEKELADARASLAAAQNVSLLTRLNEPETGPHPQGPGRTTIVLGSAGCGLAIGIGLAWLIATSPPSSGRRWSDRLLFGRRRSDRLPGVSAGVSAGERRVGGTSAQPAPHAAGPTGDLPASGAPAGRRASDGLLTNTSSLWPAVSFSTLDPSVAGDPHLAGPA